MVQPDQVSHICGCLRAVTRRRRSPVLPADLTLTDFPVEGHSRVLGLKRIRARRVKPRRMNIAARPPACSTHSAIRSVAKCQPERLAPRPDPGVDHPGALQVPSSHGPPGRAIWGRTPRNTLTARNVIAGPRCMHFPDRCAQRYSSWPLPTVKVGTPCLCIRLFSAGTSVRWISCHVANSALRRAWSSS